MLKSSFKPGFKSKWIHFKLKFALFFWFKYQEISFSHPTFLNRIKSQLIKSGPPSTKLLACIAVFCNILTKEIVGFSGERVLLFICLSYCFGTRPELHLLEMRICLTNARIASSTSVLQFVIPFLQKEKFFF